MLANLSDVLLPAQREHYAVGLFNTIDTDMLETVISAAEELRAPVIIGTAEVLLPYGELKLIAPSLRAAAERARVPVVLHYDHGLTFARCMEALKLGFTSVMFDGSAGDAAENIAATREMVRIAHAMGATVEGEIGHVGQADTGDNAATDRYTTCDPAYPDSGWLDQLADIHRGCLALQTRVRRNDHLFDIFTLKTLHQLFESDIIRSDSKHRRNRTVKHMIDALIFSCFFVCRKIPRIFHDHDRTCIPFGVAADRAKLLICQCTAFFAVADLFSRAGDRRSKLFHLVFRHVHDMKCQTLCRLRSDPRKMRKLLDQLIDVRTVVFHQKGRPPPKPPSPPVSLDITAVVSSSTLRSASLVAATIRSSSISISSGSTTSSASFTPVTSRLPDTVTSTAPPPAVAVNDFSSSAFWFSSI